MSDLDKTIEAVWKIESTRLIAAIARVTRDIGIAEELAQDALVTALEVWGPFEGIGPDLVNSVRTIKAKDGPDLILAGSSTLTSALLEHGLADELILLVSPVLLGKGKRIFAEGTPPRAFELVSTQAMPSGIVINTFKAAGPLRNLR